MRLFYKKAFTLIEFLVALVIIGFIVAILVGVFASPVGSARTSTAAVRLQDAHRQIRDAWDLYEVRTGSQPVNPGGCTADLNSIDKLVAAGYLTAAPETDKDYLLPLSVYNYCSGGGLTTNFAGCTSASGGQCLDTVMYIALAADGSRDDICAEINRISGAKRQGVPTCSENGTGNPAVPMDGPEVDSSTLQCCIGSSGFRNVFGLIRADSSVP